MNIEPNSSSRASFDYVEGLKRYVSQIHTPLLKSEFEKLGGEKAKTHESVGAILNSLPIYKFDRAIQQLSQDIMWEVVFESLASRRSELIDELNTPTTNDHGSLKLDPDLELPEYYTKVNFHRQPRSYYGDELAGIAYDLAVPIVVMRRNGTDNGLAGRALASTIPQGNYKKILDMGCGIGQKTIPIADAFPEAEVYAIDLAAPMLKYGHKRAQQIDHKIHFSQQNAEQTDFPDNTFDLVVSTILLHELPENAIQNVIAESYRILKPGGLVAHLDTPSYINLPLYISFLFDWDTLNNGEPYRTAFHNLDLLQIYRNTGFKVVHENAPASSWSRGTGFYLGKFPYWVTMGKK